MSWNGTVRCGHCYEKGHNKRSCPHLKERLEEQAAAGDSYAAERLRNNQTKKCSYCRNKYHMDDPHKHNARTCKWRIRNEKKIVNETIARRYDIYNRMQETGLNIGALVGFNEQVYRDDRYQTEQSLVTVERIVWDEVTQATKVSLDDYYARMPQFVGRRVGGPDHGRLAYVSAPIGIFDTDGALDRALEPESNDWHRRERLKEHNSAQILSPVVLQNPPGPPVESLTFKLVAREEKIRTMVADMGYGYMDPAGPPEE